MISTSKQHAKDMDCPHPDYFRFNRHGFTTEMPRFFVVLRKSLESKNGNPSRLVVHFYKRLDDALAPFKQGLACSKGCHLVQRWGLLQNCRKLRESRPQMSAQ